MNLNAAASFKVLVVGDAIEDVYRYSTPLGKGTKDPIPSVKFEREETFKGGVWASAAHLTDLVAHVDIWHGNRLTINTKYLDAYKNKLFSVHCSRDLHCRESFIPEDLKAYDLVVVFDYGLGFLDDFKRDRIMRQARYLAVNAQSNSLNFGFNRVNEKWPRADWVVVDELEARLAAHAQNGPIEDVIEKLAYPSIIVTQGAHGATGFAHKEFYREGALTERPVDLIGAGDAVLAVTAPFAKAGFSIKELVHLGNVAGMVKVGILGHQDHVSKSSLEANL